MLDQETARALLHIADESGANVAYVGDRRQLPAVGIGGVLDLVSTWTPQHIELASIHRFRRNELGEDGELVNVPDTEYAALSLDIRSGIDPGAVFDRLLADGHVQLWDSDAEALGNLALTIADRHTAGESQAVSVATNDEAGLLNGAVHEQLVERGQVDTTVTVNGSDGLELGVGDRVMTRQNDATLDVANRQVWTVTGITDTGHVEVAGDNHGHTTLEPDYVRVPAPGVRHHRLRRARRDRHPRRCTDVDEHRRRRRVRRAHPRPPHQHSPLRRRHSRTGPRTVDRSLRPGPGRFRTRPGTQRRPQRSAELPRDTRTRDKRSRAVDLLTC